MPYGDLPSSRGAEGGTSSVDRIGFTGSLWLAAHDKVNGGSRLNEYALGVGLGGGLLAELVEGGYLLVRDGELFRTSRARLPTDPALGPLLTTMVEEEQLWPATPPAAAGGAVSPVDPAGPYGGYGDAGWPEQRVDESRHRQRGHDLRTWLAYLQAEGRAERAVVERLCRLGLAQRQERRSFFGRTSASYVPCDAMVAATPADMITTAIQGRRDLSRFQLMLAGLFEVTGLHQHALATLTSAERAVLSSMVRHLNPMWGELLRAVDAAVGEAAMR
ncbi:GPP34 family phosphoprotein [Actinoplanes sp. CA-131856]